MSAREEIADLGGGCFWCLEAVFLRLKGVSSATSGYQGGALPNPTYEQVCTGATGHAEVVRVVFDPDVLSYADLLRVFFTIHDPTTLDRQGNDVGTQYRSVIFTHSPEQDATARRIVGEIDSARIHGGPVVTQMLSAPAFFPAEAYHRNYFETHQEAGYCRVVVAPKVAKFRKHFAEFWRD
jgi:peptide-methionine (S)-S-oxide reductase